MAAKPRPTREQIWSALFEALKAAPSLQAQGIQTWGRRVLPWNKVQAQPALFVRAGDEMNEFQQQMPVQTLQGEIWLYSRAGQNPTVAPDTGLNLLLDALDQAFKPDRPGLDRYTIGGLVFWARLEGRVERDPGDLDGQALAIADVLITVP